MKEGPNGEVPKKLLEIDIFARQETWNPEPSFIATTSGSREYYQREGWAYIGTRSILLDVPSALTIRQGMIAGLEMKKRHIMAEFERNKQQIDDEIQNLLALPDLSEAKTENPIGDFTAQPAFGSAPHCPDQAKAFEEDNLDFEPTHLLTPGAVDPDFDDDIPF